MIRSHRFAESEERAEEANLHVSAHLLGATIIEAAVLAGAGIVLFFAPTLAHDIWGWELTPFNSRFLGSVYFGSLVAVGTLVGVRRWATARLVVPMIFAFTIVVLLVSLGYVGRFEWDRPVTWAWFFIFIAVPADAAYFLWTLRRTPAARPGPPQQPIRLGLLAAAVPLTAYGIGLLVAPGTLTGFWPWTIDALHGRLYSAIFITLALAAVVASNAAARIDLIALGLTCVVLGRFQIAGLLAVDADVDRVDWARAGTWAWIASFAAILAGGAALAAAGLRRERLSPARG